MSFAYSPSIIKDGLVFYMDAANPNCYISGNTTCNDLMSGNVGTLENSVGFSTENNGFWSFDGANDNIDFGITPSLQLQTFSWSLWVNPNSWGQTRCSIMLGQSSNYGFSIYFLAPNILVCMGGNGTNDSYNNSRVTNADTYLPDNSWGHITFTHELIGPAQWQQKIYINNILRNTYQIVHPNYIINYLNHELFVGKRYNNTAFYRGNISNIKCYNKALSQTEITRNYNALKGRFGL